MLGPWSVVAPTVLVKGQVNCNPWHYRLGLGNLLMFHPGENYDHY